MSLIYPLSESILNQDPHILSCVIFGCGRFQAGVLVDPKPAFKFDPSDTVKLAEFRNQNERLFPAAFKAVQGVAKPDKPFTYTAKMGVRRQAIIANYEEEIAALYDGVEQSAALDIPLLLNWNTSLILNFVCDAIHNVMAARLGDDDNMFQHGCDSLQATWIRNALLRALRDSAQLDTSKDTRNFVYEHPTIAWLADFVFAVASEMNSQDVSAESRSSAMHEMVAKYAQDLSRHASEKNSPSATEKQPALYKRQAHALVDRGLDASILDSPKLSMLEGDLVSPAFDLAGPIYQKMQRSVTHIIHNGSLEGDRGRGQEGGWKWVPRVEVDREGDPRQGRGIHRNETDSQLCGGVNGTWNTHEWVPALVQSAKVLKCIPDDSRDVSWILVHLAAAAIIDFLDAIPAARILHLTLGARCNIPGQEIGRKCKGNCKDSGYFLEISGARKFEIYLVFP
ncbi:hypothetical protein B0H17DRAFT_1130264 [Mycena rosella]|uniref:Uncharacterized protein n=1 Tax=Mycena rosella TaxID=1033263 RepID=A0AAD7DRZ4_MYCRO|nr:hypothetical protein B0H17DRAFT_1130264 [Mycena rosella]